MLFQILYFFGVQQINKWFSQILYFLSVSLHCSLQLFSESEFLHSFTQFEFNTSQWNYFDCIHCRGTLGYGLFIDLLPPQKMSTVDLGQSTYGEVNYRGIFWFKHRACLCLRVFVDLISMETEPLDMHES